MMSTRPKTYGTFCAAMLLQVALAGASAASETAIENQIDTVNKHFEVASEYFGDGTVQMHSKREGADGTFHSVHQFDCVNKNYDTLYDGDFTPDAVPKAFIQSLVRTGTVPYVETREWRHRR